MATTKVWVSSSSFLSPSSQIAKADVLTGVVDTATIQSLGDAFQSGGAIVGPVALYTSGLIGYYIGDPVTVIGVAELSPDGGISVSNRRYESFSGSREFAALGSFNARGTAVATKANRGQGSEAVVYRFSENTEVWIPNPDDVYVILSPSGGVAILCNNASGVIKAYDSTDGSALWQATVSDAAAFTSFSNHIFIGYPGEELLVLDGGTEFIALDVNTGSETRQSMPAAAQNRDALGLYGYSETLGVGLISYLNTNGFVIETWGIGPTIADQTYYSGLENQGLTHTPAQFDAEDGRFYTGNAVVRAYNYSPTTDNFYSVLVTSDGGAAFDASEIIGYAGTIAPPPPTGPEPPFWTALNKTLEIIE